MMYYNTSYLLKLSNLDQSIFFNKLLVDIEKSSKLILKPSLNSKKLIKKKSSTILDLSNDSIWSYSCEETDDCSNSKSRIKYY